MARKPSTLESLFWPNVDFGEKEVCWPWNGSTGDDGYGLLREGGRGGKLLKAHRVGFCLWRGLPLEAIEGFKVRHTCDRPSCVNPHHLVLGSQAENMSDMRERGRSLTGEKNTHAKLTWDSVREMRKLWADGVLNQAELAERYNCSRPTVSGILANKNWKEEEANEPA